MNLPGWTDKSPGDPPGGTHVFATTHWSLVLAAREGDASGATEALEKLCRTYWYPLYAFVRRQGHSPEDAQDSTQAFFAHLLARDFLRGLSKENGRFRTFLLTSLRNFLSDQWDKARALKRGGGQPAFSLDAADAEARYQLEPADELSADHIYERRWALALLDQALARLREEFAAADKAELFDVLRQFQGDEPNPATCAEAAARLAMPENTFKSHLRRFRQRYRELLCEEVAQTVATPADVAEELRCLKAVLAG
jgi:RNA polymerase sigma-70 factor (ECF subfamily)